MNVTLRIQSVHFYAQQMYIDHDDPTLFMYMDIIRMLAYLLILQPPKEEKTFMALFFEQLLTNKKMLGKLSLKDFVKNIKISLASKTK